MQTTTKRARIDPGPPSGWTLRQLNVYLNEHNLVREGARTLNEWRVEQHMQGRPVRTSTGTKKAQDADLAGPVRLCFEKVVQQVRQYAEPVSLIHIPLDVLTHHLCIYLPLDALLAFARVSRYACRAAQLLLQGIAVNRYGPRATPLALALEVFYVHVVRQKLQIEREIADTTARIGTNRRLRQICRTANEDYTRLCKVLSPTHVRNALGLRYKDCRQDIVSETNVRELVACVMSRHGMVEQIFAARQAAAQNVVAMQAEDQYIRSMLFVRTAELHGAFARAGYEALRLRLVEDEQGSSLKWATPELENTLHLILRTGHRNSWEKQLRSHVWMKQQQLPELLAEGLRKICTGAQLAQLVGQMAKHGHVFAKEGATNDYGRNFPAQFFLRYLLQVSRFSCIDQLFEPGMIQFLKTLNAEFIRGTYYLIWDPQKLEIVGRYVMNAYPQIVGQAYAWRPNGREEAALVLRRLTRDMEPSYEFQLGCPFAGVASVDIVQEDVTSMVVVHCTVRKKAMGQEPE